MQDKHSKNLHDFLQAAKSILRENGVESPDLSAELLLAATLGTDRSELLKKTLLQPESPLKQEEAAQFRQLLDRRLQGEPTAYILGEKEFYGRPFSVNRATLIPRPETEMIVEMAVAYARTLASSSPKAHTHPEITHARRFFADLGTGSGCLAVTLALELSESWQGLAVDISPEALTTAKANAQKFDVKNQLTFVCADYRLQPFPPESYDLIVSNPPYIGSDEYQDLHKSVREYEPATALVPSFLRARVADAAATPTAQETGYAVSHNDTTMPERDVTAATGLEDLTAILPIAHQALRAGGLLIMEMGWTQGEVLLRQARSFTWKTLRVVQDLAGLDRILFAQKV